MTAAFLGDFLAGAFFLAGLDFLGVLATALIQGPLAIAQMETTAGAAIYVQESPVDLDRAALRPEPLDLALRLAVGEEAGFAALAATIEFGG